MTRFWNWRISQYFHVGIKYVIKIVKYDISVEFGDSELSLGSGSLSNTSKLQVKMPSSAIFDFKNATESEISRRDIILRKRGPGRILTFAEW